MIAGSLSPRATLHTSGEETDLLWPKVSEMQGLQARYLLTRTSMLQRGRRGTVKGYLAEGWSQDVF